MDFLGEGMHGALQHAVNAKPYDHTIDAGFHVNIAGPPLESRKDDRIEEPNDRARANLGGGLLHGDIFVGVFVLGKDLERKAFRGAIENPLRLFGTLQ